MTSQQLKKARQSLGLTITAMAQALNTPRGTYEKWEYGSRRVPGIIEIALLQLTQAEVKTWQEEQNKN